MGHFGNLMYCTEFFFSCLDCAFQMLVKMSVECQKSCFRKIELLGTFICLSKQFMSSLIVETNFAYKQLGKKEKKFQLLPSILFLATASSPLTTDFFFYNFNSRAYQKSSLFSFLHLELNHESTGKMSEISGVPISAMSSASLNLAQTQVQFP